MRPGEPKACWDRAASSARCSGVIEASIRWAAAARAASASTSSSTARGCSGKKSPCRSMKSRNCSVVSSPRAWAARRSLRSRSISSTRSRSSSRGVLEGLLHAGEPLVEQLATEEVLDLLVLLAGLAAAPVVVGELGDGRRRRGRQALHPHLGEAGVVVEVAGELLALGEHGLVEEPADLLEGAAEGVLLEELPAPCGDLPGEVVEPGARRRSAPEQLAHGPLG